MFIAYWYLYMIVLSEIWLIPFPIEREPGNTGALLLGSLLSLSFTYSSHNYCVCPLQNKILTLSLIHQHNHSDITSQQTTLTANSGPLIQIFLQCQRKVPTYNCPLWRWQNSLYRMICRLHTLSFDWSFLEPNGSVWSKKSRVVRQWGGGD